MKTTSDLTIEELAVITRKHPETLRRLARTSRLPGVYRIGQRWMISIEAANKLRGLPAEVDCK
jgi:hypothetical protein